MSEIFLSICILTYKRNRLLRKLLSQLTDGLPSGAEVVVIDTSGAGEARQAIDAFLNKESEIIPYYATERLNISKGRNQALDMARGEWILFLDDDQGMNGRAIEKLIFEIKKECVRDKHFNAGMLAYRLEILDDSDHEEKNLLERKLKKSQYFLNSNRKAGTLDSHHMGTGGAFFMTPPKEVRFMEKLGFSGGEDNEFFLRYLGSKKCPVWDDYNLVEYVMKDRMTWDFLAKNSFRKGGTYVDLQTRYLGKNKLSILMASFITWVLSFFILVIRILSWRDWPDTLALLIRQVGKIARLIGYEYEFYKKNDTNCN